MSAIIQINNINKTYEMENGPVYALKDANLSINKGEFVAIVGQSGSGKSTLMNIIGCLDTPSGGDYYLDGENVAKMSERKLSHIRNHTIGFVFQGFNLIPELTALENVELPLAYRGSKKAARQALAIESLTNVGLADRMHHKPAQMSGGQQQRVAIARAVSAQPSIILADEPTGNLDRQHGNEIIETLINLNNNGCTIVLITHDEYLASMAHRIIKIEHGCTG